MLALALDTTTPGGSCAVVRDGVVLVETDGDPAVSHAARLPRDLMAALDASGVTLREVDVFAVATGPGSFTGLRVGIATMQGLAMAAGRPLAGVSAFDAMARMVSAGLCGVVPVDALLATWVDAWRGDVYAARYAGAREVDAPSVEAPARLLERLAATHGGPTMFIGRGAERRAEAIHAVLGARAVFAAPAAPAVAAAIARIALDEASRGAVPAPDEIRPLYVRRLDDVEVARGAAG